MEGSETAAAPPTAAPTVSKRYLVFLVVLMGLVSQMDSWLSLIETKAIPFILEEFYGTLVTSTREIARSEFALLQGIFGILVFGVFFIGWFGDAYGRKKGMILLVLVMGLPTILIVSLSLDVYWFLFFYSMVIMGTTSNLWEVPVSEEAPADKRGLYGSLAFLIGVVPIYAILGTRIIDAIGWRWGYGIMFFFMFVVLTMLYFMKDPQRWKDKEAAREKRLGVMEALRKLSRRDMKYIAIASIVYLAWTISFKMATTWGGEFFQAVWFQSDDQFNSILTVAGLLLPVSALISGLLLDKIGRNYVLVIGTIGSVICYCGLGYGQDIMTLSVFYWGAYFFMAMVLAWIYVYLAEIFPTEIRTTSIGVCVTGARIGYVIGPILAGILLAMFESMDGFWIIGGLLMLIPLITLTSKPFETKGKELEAIEIER